MLSKEEVVDGKGEKNELGKATRTAVGVAPAIMAGIGLSSDAPYPHAVQLFIHFMLSRDAQKLMQGFGRLVARTDLTAVQSGAVKGVNFVPVNPGLAEKIGEYARQLRAIFGGS